MCTPLTFVSFPFTERIPISRSFPVLTLNLVFTRPTSRKRELLEAYDRGLSVPLFFTYLIWDHYKSPYFLLCPTTLPHVCVHNLPTPILLEWHYGLCTSYHYVNETPCPLSLFDHVSGILSSLERDKIFCLYGWTDTDLESRIRSLTNLHFRPSIRPWSEAPQSPV